MIETWNITIPTLTGDEPRKAYVYVPDLFEDDPDRRYPVLYMFDGHNLFFDDEATYGKSWGLLEYLEDTQTPLIIAAAECNHHPNNGRLSEYSPFTAQMPGFGHVRGRGKRTMNWLVHDFKPYIDAHYPTLPDRAHTFLAGSSMGGLMTLYGVMQYNRVFSRGAALSPSLWFAQDQLFEMLRSSRVRRDTVLYMDYGRRELGYRSSMLQGLAQTAAILLDKQVNLTFRIVPDGDHSEASWERQIPFFMDALFYGLEL